MRERSFWIKQVEVPTPKEDPAFSLVTLPLVTASVSLPLVGETVSAIAWRLVTASLIPLAIHWRGDFR